MSHSKQFQCCSLFVLAVLATACGQVANEASTPTAAAKAPFQLNESELVPLPRLTAADIDTAVPACSGIDAMVNAKWLAANPMPADKTRWGSFEMLRERSLSVQKQLAEHAAADMTAVGVDKLVGDIFATGMDEAALNAAGITPIKTDLDAIAALADGAAIAGYLRESAARGDNFLFGFGPNEDFKDSTMSMAYASQSGLGLPDREYYFSKREDQVAAREAYQAYIARLLELTGAAPAAAAGQAKAVLEFETRLAKVSRSSEELSRDVSLYYNPLSVDEADKLTPNFRWSEFLDAQGVARPAKFSLAQPEFHKEVSAMLTDTPVASWQAYLRFHTIDGAAPFLTDELANANFEFYGKTLRGQKEMQARWKRVLGSVNAQVGEAFGQIYVKYAFPPESKAKMQSLVTNLSAALKVRLEALPWMSAETKTKALEKWASFTPKIGYPDKWRDWAGLKTSRGSYYQNLQAANEFNYKWSLGKIGKPVDRSEWGMSPQTVNAYYNPFKNEIVFPAAILQPPFFDAQTDDAINYGAIGGVIGHEMIHGYDDQGSRFDAKGNFENWWSDADKQGFEALTGKLVEQFNAYESIDGIHVNGNLTLGENIADLGGLAVAFDAMKRARGANFTDAKLDGYTQEQRFFLSWVTVWRTAYTPETLKVNLTTDPHAPGNFRAIAAPSNMPEFVEAFACKADDPMVRSGEARIAIW